VDKTAIKLVVSTTVVCIVAAAGLGMTYGVTKDRIAKMDREAEVAALRAVLPDAKRFSKVAAAEDLAAAKKAAGEVTFVSAYSASSSGGDPAGWGVRVASRGYGGPMQLVIGLDRDGKVTGVSIVAMNETPGLGTKVLTEKWFMRQFTKLPAGASDADLRKLDAISGATKSSRGVRHGVEAAVRVWRAAFGGGGGN